LIPDKVFTYLSGIFFIISSFTRFSKPGIYQKMFCLPWFFYKEYILTVLRLYKIPKRDIYMIIDGFKINPNCLDILFKYIFCMICYLNIIRYFILIKPVQSRDNSPV